MVNTKKLISINNLTMCCASVNKRCNTVGATAEQCYMQSTSAVLIFKCTVGRGGALVETMTFNRRVVGSTPALAATYGPWASPELTVACALLRETPIQYSCCSRERL